MSKDKINIVSDNGKRLLLECVPDNEAVEQDDFESIEVIESDAGDTGPAVEEAAANVTPLHPDEESKEVINARKMMYKIAGSGKSSAMSDVLAFLIQTPLEAKPSQAAMTNAIKKAASTSMGLINNNGTLLAFLFEHRCVVQVSKRDDSFLRTLNSLSYAVEDKNGKKTAKPFSAFNAVTDPCARTVQIRDNAYMLPGRTIAEAEKLARARNVFTTFMGLVDEIENLDDVEECPIFAKRFNEYLLDQLCAGNVAVADYLLKFIAEKFQTPEKKQKIAVVACGARKGTGKSMLGNIVSSLFHRSHDGDLSGDDFKSRFNSHNENAIILRAEEVTHGADSAADSRIKNLITADWINIEQKGMPIRRVENFQTVYVTSNQTNPVTVTEGERRYLVLDADKGKFGKNDQIFTDIATRDLNGKLVLPKIKALVNMLKNVDLSDFNAIKNLPETAHSKAMMAASARTYIDLINDIADGTVDKPWLDNTGIPASSFEFTSDELRISVMSFREVYEKYRKAAGGGCRLPRGAAWADILAEYDVKSKNMRVNGRQSKGYVFQVNVETGGFSL